MCVLIFFSVGQEDDDTGKAQQRVVRIPGPRTEPSLAAGEPQHDPVFAGRLGGLGGLLGILSAMSWDRTPTTIMTYGYTFAYITSHLLELHLQVVS